MDEKDIPLPQPPTSDKNDTISSSPPPAPVPPKVTPLSRAKTITKPLPKMDYSALFPTAMSFSPGVYVYMIDNLTPIEIEFNSDLTLCRGDAYIFIHAFGGSEDHSSRDDTLEFQIYTWIGESAELDKKFCAAMYAVGVREHLASKCNVGREVS